MIQVEGGITIGPGITMGAVTALPVFLVAENNDQLISEDNNLFIED
jgi:hypothetical protein